MDCFLMQQSPARFGKHERIFSQGSRFNVALCVKPGKWFFRVFTLGSPNNARETPPYVVDTEAEGKGSQFVANINSNIQLLFCI